MKKPKKNASAISNLREKAEKLLENKPLETGAHLNETETKKLVHELQVHQLELEMMVDELSRAKEETELALQKYTDLFDFAPTSYFTLTKAGKIVELNPQGANMLGKQRSVLLNSIFTFFVSDDTKTTFNLFLQKIFSKKTKQTCGVTLIPHNKPPLYVLIKGVISKNGEQCKLNTFDISKQIQVEKALRVSEENNRISILQTAMDGYWLLDRKGNILEVNQTYCRMSAYSCDELLGMHISNLEAKENKSEIEAHLLLVEERGEHRFETQHRRRDGSILDVEISTLCQKKDKIQFVVFIHDISQRKKAELELRQSEERYRALFKANQSVMLIIEPETGALKDANPAAIEYYGWTHKELCSKNISDINILAKAELKKELLKAKNEKRNQFVFKHRLASNEIRDVEVFSGPISFNQSKYLYSIVHDITNRTKTEVALRESENKFRQYIDFSPHGIFIANEKGEYLEVNEAACQITGYRKEELLSMKLFEFIPDDQLEIGASHFNQVVKEGFASGEMQFVRKDRSIGFWLVDAVRLSHNRFLGFVADVTDRKQAELAHLESKNTLSAVLNSATEAITLFSSEGKLLMGNQTALNRLELSTGQISGQSYMDLFEKKLAQSRFEKLQEVVQSKNAVEFEDERNGIFYQHNFYPVLEEAGKVNRVAIFSRDITERKIKDEIIKKINRMFAALGKSSQAMIRYTEESEYLSRVCQIIVEDCGFSKVWIGMAEEDENKSIRPVASAGFTKGFQESQKLSWGDPDCCFCPSARAISSGKIVVYKNLLTNPEFEPWLEQIKEMEFESAMSLPLIEGDKTFGAITIFESNPDPFVPDEIKLLTELANDLAHGITAFRLKKAHQDALEKLNSSHALMEGIVEERTRELKEINGYLLEEIRIRHEKEKSLEKTEEKYRTLADYNYHWETWLNPEGKYIYVSPSCLRITGYDVQEFTDDAALFYKIAHPKDKKMVQDHFLVKTCGKAADVSFDFRIITKGGEERWISHFCRSVYNGEGKWLGQRASNSDITARKRAESFLINSHSKLRALTRRLNEIAENERKNIAREIHDELGHVLTALKYDIDNLLNNKDLTVKEVKEELPIMISMVESLIDSVRKIATELRPGILDHLGLFPAIEWQIQQFRMLTKISCEYTPEELDLEFNKNETTTIFRILQELLTNVARHSKAKKLQVQATKLHEEFLLQVKDDGIGFNLTDNFNSKSLGLIGMQERALSIGGRINVESSPGEGTCVSFLLKK